MSTKPWSEWTADQAPGIGLAIVLVALVVIRLAGGDPFRLDDLALLGVLVLGALTLILTIPNGTRPRRSVGLTERFQSDQEMDEARRHERVRRWFEAHPAIDRIYRVATVVCLIAAVAGALLTWRHGASYSPWPHLANMFAITLIGLRGPSNARRRRAGSLGAP